MAPQTKSLLEIEKEKAPAEGIKERIEHNHATAHLLEAKKAAKTHGAAGRFRGKAKAKQNNKARGGKMAR